MTHWGAMTKYLNLTYKDFLPKQHQLAFSADPHVTLLHSEWCLGIQRERGGRSAGEAGLGPLSFVQLQHPGA